MSRLTMTCWSGVKDPIGKRVQTNWQAFCRRMAKPIATVDKMTLPGFALASFTDDRRAKANVEQVYALGFDFDDLTAPFADLCGAFTHAAFLHTTFSSTSDAPRARAFVLLSRPVTAAEHERLWSFCDCVMAAGGQKCDPAAKDASRLWFPSATTPGAGELAFRCHVVDRAPLDADATLARLPAPPPPVRYKATPGATDGDVVERARAYLAKCEPSISGSGGHSTAFLVAQKLVRGFGLDDATAFALLSSEWNPRCVPPWSQHDLIRKVRQAVDEGRMEHGALRDAPRRTA